MRVLGVRPFSFFVVSLLVPAAMAQGQGLEHVKANFTKYEYRIPMRDGKRLFTAVYVPKDDAQTWPILLTRTPYSAGPYGADQYKSDLGPSPLFGNRSLFGTTPCGTAPTTTSGRPATCGRI